jgi:APA family basic amino acid/polyamine antiporter
LRRTVISASDASLADLTRLSLGSQAAGAASIIALVLLLLFMFTWTRSATRLVYALARESVLPPALARVGAGSGSPVRAALALGGAWALAFAVQILLGVPLESYIQLASGNFLLTYVLIVLAAWRLLFSRRFLLALVISTLAILLLVVAGFQSLWYALVTALLFGLIGVARRRATGRRRATPIPVPSS